MAAQLTKAYLILRRIENLPDPKVLYMFHDLDLAHQYMDTHVVGDRYDVLNTTISADGLRTLHVHDAYTWSKLDVWIETVNIMDVCVVDNLLGGAEGDNGRVEDCWAPVDRETFQRRYVD